MQKSIILFQLILLASSIFSISHHFANPSTPTLYISAGGCSLLAILLLVQRYKQQTLSFSITEALSSGFLLYVIVYGSINGSLNPEWIITGLSLGLFYSVVKRINLSIEWLFIESVLIGISQAIYGLGQYLNWFNNIAAHGFRMGGSFDNPAGFAAVLSICFPFVLFLFTRKGLHWKIIGGFSVVVITLAVILSQSRAGVIALIVISGVWASMTFDLKWFLNLNSRIKIVGSVLFILILLVGLYSLKKDSANGRLLIWQCSAHMIADKPFFGHGVGGFQQEYMPYQAEYFRDHPDSSFTMLADNVKHPFNEYLLLLVEHGLVGGLLFGFFIFCVIRNYHKNKNLQRFYALLCLVGVAVFSFFSYPLGYPFIWLMVVFCAALIMQNETQCWIIQKGVFSFIKPAALLISIALLFITCKIFYDEYRWNAIAQRSLAGETKAVMPYYATLYKTMNQNGLFLYNYAAELNFIDRNKQSNRIFMEASRFMNDIDLQLQMADNYQKMKQYKEAERCLVLASEMIPNRFILRYRLAKLYEETNQMTKAKDIAKQLLTKPVKVISTDIMTIKAEMQELIKNGSI